ncbi:IclR family transcriptional regulator [uncultured Jatrophihabitans sp.]|uniref:IclR family transcriptional regulator n=1 Tax=uncultured Jatrophihabitans sp. TaxID=1610747 RepID=UPI0035CB6F4A
MSGDGGSARGESGGLQSVDRALSVLEIVAQSVQGATVGDVAAELGVHKSTASRLLSTLEGRELVEQVGERGRYHLGFGVLRLASAVLSRLDLVSEAREVLRDVAVTVGETVNLAVLRSHWAVNVDQARGLAAVVAQNWTGQLTPLHATSSGKVLLAHESPASRQLLLDSGGLARFTRYTHTSRPALLTELDRIVESGYGVALEEYAEGLNAVAAPIRNHTRAVVASLSVSGPAFRLDRRRIDAIVPDVREAARRVSERLGHVE